MRLKTPNRGIDLDATAEAIWEALQSQKQNMTAAEIAQQAGFAIGIWLGAASLSEKNFGLADDFSRGLADGTQTLIKEGLEAVIKASGGRN